MVFRENRYVLPFKVNNYSLYNVTIVSDGLIRLFSWHPLYREEITIKFGFLNSNNVLSFLQNC